MRCGGEIETYTAHPKNYKMRNIRYFLPNTKCKWEIFVSIMDGQSIAASPYKHLISKA